MLLSSCAGVPRGSKLLINVVDHRGTVAILAEDFHMFIEKPRSQIMMGITAVTNKGVQNRSALLQLQDTCTGEVWLLPTELK